MASAVAPAALLPVTVARVEPFLVRVSKSVSRPVRTVATSIGLAIAATVLFQLVVPKLYESTALVRVERPSAEISVGLAGSLDKADGIIATEIETAQSDPVLRPVAERFRLLAAGKQLTGRDAENAVDKSAATIRLKHLRVTSLPNSYMIRITYRANNPQLAANVANAVAQSLVEHAKDTAKSSFDQIATVVDQNMPDLVVKMEASSKSLAEFERELNMADPAQRVLLLTNRVAQLNSQLTAAQNERIHREAIVAQVNASDTFAAAQTAAQDNLLSDALQRLNSARQHFASTRSYYGERHPEYAKAQKQVQELETQLHELQADAKNRAQVEYRETQSQESRLSGLLEQTKAELEKLQTSAHQYENLKNEAENDRKTYEQLATHARTGAIDQQIHRVTLQIAAPALVPDEPVFPKLPLNLALAILGSGTVGIAVAALGKALDPTFSVPEDAKSKLRLDVLASLPKAQCVLGTSALNDITGRPNMLKPSAESAVRFEEGVRELRAALLLAMSNQPVRNVLVTSAAPGEGTSTIAAYLAIACAQAGQKVLLVDANLRRPALDSMFGSSSTHGLSQVLKGEWPLADATVALGQSGLFLLPAGHVSRRAADLIALALPPLLAKASRVFDLVIVDAPAVLGASELLPMARAADGVVLLTKAAATTKKAASQALAGLLRARANVLGFVINQAELPDTPNANDYPKATGFYDVRRLRLEPELQITARRD